MSRHDNRARDLHRQDQAEVCGVIDKTATITRSLDFSNRKPEVGQHRSGEDAIIWHNDNKRFVISENYAEQTSARGITRRMSSKQLESMAIAVMALIEREESGAVAKFIGENPIIRTRLNLDTLVISLKAKKAR